MELNQKVKKIIDGVRPAVQADGGDVELVDVNAQTGVVTVRLHGACVGCALADITVHAGLEQRLRKSIPEITAVKVTA
ncbi:MAG: hypothetical protein A2840_00110 [Candidatus Buchananbacteria bacterium RIFCSPHIGHO2_01_FULL_47_11b]|uniref:NIF system FeS cluster assembly NifU C-terminal domain-containing protein n=1 Tax=Candidatus Buchananbacteria bacterium RIFCSPHIGHO2_01_FULL_47_11b TaxID=1797537 RepID=A0A1G1Y5R3_9BACT|nr:MAG: hypothetical protein A2840_00110 [Candidatus Buchananbacteria bacterium RIFCSPHIGHO2_01_FULL_47_11b]